MKEITITHDEAVALYHHLDYYILQSIKDDPDYDNMDYLLLLTHVYERCKKEKEVDQGVTE